MRKMLTTAAIAASMVLASTSAAAANRPQATRFSQPISAEASEGRGKNTGFLLFTGALSIAAIIALISALGGNSPNR